MRRSAWLGLFGSAALLGACGKSEGSSGPVTLEQLPARAADIACGGLARCCADSGHDLNVTTCKRNVAAELDEELSEELSVNVRYDADAAGRCLDALAANSRCGDLEEGDAGACERVFNGTLALGKPCRESAECRKEPGQYVSCYSSDGLSQAVCTLEMGSSGPAPRGKQGDACLGTCFEGDNCDYDLPALPAPGPGLPAPSPGELVICHRSDGLYCDFLGLCQPLGALGTPCTLSESCAGGAFCAFVPANFESGTCTAPRADGEPCDSNDECGSDNCDYQELPAIQDPGAPVTAAGTCVPAHQVSAEQCNVGDDVAPDDADSSGDRGSSVDPNPTPP